MRLSLVVMALVLASETGAQNRGMRVLLPLYLERPVSGAFGSTWVSHFAVHNGSTGEVLLEWCSRPPDEAACILNLQHDEQLLPNETHTELPVRYLESHSGGAGAVLYVRPRAAADLDVIAFQLRVADTSRASTNAGTEIPVVRESEFLNVSSRLLRIPADARFRPTLRLYEMDLAMSDFIVSVHDETSNVLLRQFAVHMESPSPEKVLRFEPAYAEITDFIGPTSSPFVRVEVRPLSENARFWTFVSVTNNDTQHVTVITPQ